MPGSFGCDEAPSLGPCCCCETMEDVRVIVMLNRLAPVPGTGWGCVVCGVPQDGAIAVLCDPCAEAYRQRKIPPRLVCSGLPDSGERLPYYLLEGKFDHDLSFHPEVEGEAT